MDCIQQLFGVGGKLLHWMSRFGFDCPVLDGLYCIGLNLTDNIHNQIFNFFFLFFVTLYKTKINAI